MFALKSISLSRRLTCKINLEDEHEQKHHILRWQYIVSCLHPKCCLAMRNTHITTNEVGIFFTFNQNFQKRELSLAGWGMCNYSYGHNLSHLIVQLNL